MKKFFLSFILSGIFFNHAFSQPCTPAVNGNIYHITTNLDGGPGSLRQAIIDANTDNVGGTVEIIGGWVNFPINSPLPLITCDSLQIFPNQLPITIDGQGIVMEPAITFSSELSCFDYFVTGINMIPGNITVINTNETGAGSIREAIRSANFSTTSDQIRFNIPGPSPHKIQLSKSLPKITKSAIVDGSTQPANGYTGTAPKIELSGPGGTSFGLYFDYSDATHQYNGAVYGMYINGFATGIETNATNSFILGAVGKGNVISGNNSATYLYYDLNTIQQYNYIGVDTSGYLAEPNNHGLAIAGIAAGSHLVKNNVISGNSNGVLIFNTTHNVTFNGNLVGTDKTGTFAIPNADKGISCSGTNVIVGGLLPADGNLFSGHGDNSSGAEKAALFIDGDSCLVIGNKFGTNLAGTSAIPNNYGSAIYLNPSASAIRIGGTTAAEKNIIAASPSGIRTTAGLNLIIKGNTFGLDVTGTVALPNGTALNLGCDSSQIIGNVIANSINNNILLDIGTTKNVLLNNHVFNGNQHGIWNRGEENTFTQNQIDGNALDGIYNFNFANDSISAPVITHLTNSNVLGTSAPFAIVELYESASYNVSPQGTIVMGSVTADVNGNWSYSGTITNPLFVTTTQTDSEGNTSAFSPYWPTGLSPLPENQTFQIFPNPSTSVVNLIFNSPAHRTISVKDITGRVVLTQETSETEVQINVANLPQGVYVVESFDPSGALLRSSFVVGK